MVVKTQHILFGMTLFVSLFSLISLAVCQRMLSEPPSVRANSQNKVRYVIPPRKVAKPKVVTPSGIEKTIEFAAQKAKIRPQFFSGIIQVESSNGKFIGNGNWREDLSNPKCELDRLAFLYITKRLKLDPDKMPVSKRQDYGPCGGAMGVAQIMPANFLEYHKKVSEITRSGFPNPWNERDSLLTGALMLCDLGACDKSPDAEREAALKYLAGANWHKPEFQTYGDQVMMVALRIPQ